MTSRERGEMRDRVSAEGSGLSWGQKRGPWRSAEPISSSGENTAYWDGVHTLVTSLQDVTTWLWRQAKPRGDREVGMNGTECTVGGCPWAPGWGRRS